MSLLSTNVLCVSSRLRVPVKVSASPSGSLNPVLSVGSVTVVPPGALMALVAGLVVVAVNTGARFTGVPLAEADHGLSRSPNARTCTRYAVFAVSPVMVADVLLPGSGGPFVSPSSIQSAAFAGSAAPAK